MKLELDENSKNPNLNTDKPDPFSSVTYVKGVGPKVASMLNKLGVFTASDLLFYFPRKHIDYSQRTLIRNLQLGQTTTVFGYIKSVESFVTHFIAFVFGMIMGLLLQKKSKGDW